MKASIALLISGLAAQQVAATWNRNANFYKTPEYNNNECTDKQKGGYDWSDLNEGDTPGNAYDGNFDFSGGWKCKNSFGKRDHLTKRTFGTKSLTNKCGEKKPASFSCKGKKDGFSATEFQISTEYDTDVDFHYKMPDGSTCKQRSSCKKEGTTVKNTQCGGAETVEVYLPPGGGKGKGENGEDKEDCEIGFHHIGFDCNPPVEYTPPPAYTPSPPPETSTPPPETTTPPPETTTPPPETSTPPPSTITTCGTDYEGQTPCESTSTPPPETTTPPPETTTESPPPPNTTCGTGEGQTPCDSTSTPPPETTTPPPETTTPPPGTTETPPPSTITTCGTDYEGQTPCDSTSTPPPETTTPAPSCGTEGQPPCDTTTPPPETTTPAPSCGTEGQPPCDTTTPPPETTTPAPSCGTEGQPPCDTTTPPPETTTPAPSCGTEGQPPCDTTTPPPATSTPPSECGNGYGQTPCESTSTPPAETTPGTTAPATSTPPTSSGTGYGPGTPESSTTTNVSPVQPTPSPSAPSYTAPPGGYTPPEVLPSCLNTWLQVNTQCKDNTDSACYCKIPNFTDNVLACVAARGTEQEQTEAVQYFIGICAPALPENPGIITNCPSQIPINPTAPSAPATSAPATTAPGYSTGAPAVPTTSAPAPGAPAPYPVTTVEAGGSTYTVPQVGFTTEAPTAPGANPTEPVALYPGVTPAPAPATTTGAAAPYPTGPSGLTSVVVPTGTGAPSGTGLPEFTGAASPLNVQLKGAVFGGAILAFFAL